MALDGRVEIISTEFAIGWAQISGGRPAPLFASLDDRIIGMALAQHTRPDLDEAGAAGGFSARTYCILFDQSVPADRLADITVCHADTRLALIRNSAFKLDPSPVRQVFVLGSPRSGTSELAATLSRLLALPWLGEGHAGPLFAGAAAILTGDAASPNDMVRYMAAQNFRNIVVERARAAYYGLHGSASFLDKTPGIPMIEAAPFLHECFPAAKFIYLRRNGISNVLSRMAKFGGVFEEHCEDWAAAINRWEEIKHRLPHFLELRQEDMLDMPEAVAARVAAYLAAPDKAAAIAASLRAGKTEQTGAGLGRMTLAETGWTEAEKAVFSRICGATMEQFGYNF
jgi:hypothetical protein